MNVPAPWNLGTPAPKPGDPMRYRLSWETDPTYPAAEPVDGEVEIFRRRSDDSDDE